MGKICDFCKRKIHGAPVRKGNKIFCNHLCEAGEEIELLKKNKAPA